MIIPCCEINNSCNVISWLFPTLPDGVEEAGYTQQLYALGVNVPARYNLLSGSLPPGLTLSSSGLIDGTIAPFSEGLYDFTVSVYDAHRCYSTKAYSITVNVNTGFKTFDQSHMIFGTSHFKFSDRWPS